MFKNFSNELSIITLSFVVNRLNNSISKTYTEFDNCIGYDFLLYKLKELKKYLYEIKFELALISEENSLYLYDLKSELVRVEKEFIQLNNYK